MGIMCLPSLTEKKFVVIKNVSLIEAKNFADDFTARLIASRKTKDAGETPGTLVVYENMLESLDFRGEDDEIAAEMFEALMLSNVTGIRGARVVYMDCDTGTFAVGTAVVYNLNWATINFDDNTILDKVRSQGFELTIDDLDDLDEEDFPNMSWWDKVA